MMAAEDSLYSSQREAMLEHIFVGEVMRQLWIDGTYGLEVLKPQVDSAGYDLVLEARGAVRHVQLKSTKRGSSVAGVTVSLRLADKPSGCVIIIEFDKDLKLGPFHWFGNAPGGHLPDILALRVAKHTKANALGEKLDRPGLRVIPRSRFETLDRIEDVVRRLFPAQKSVKEPQSIKKRRPG